MCAKIKGANEVKRRTAMLYHTWESVLGTLHLCQQDNKLTALHLPNHSKQNVPLIPNFMPSPPTFPTFPTFRPPPTPLLALAQQQIDGYFQGVCKTFSLPLQAKGTEFQEKVWQALLEIPYGDTWTYEQLAVFINHPKSCRAVGAANGKNPLPLLLPCHRVVPKQGGVGGYLGGTDTKKQLLTLEQKYNTSDFPITHR